MYAVTSLTCAVLLLAAGTSFAQESAEDLAMKLSNPVASLISAPLQFNMDGNIGSEDGMRNLLNIQPVIPSSLNDNWNLISRVILPVVQQSNIAGDSGSQFGFGDALASFFFSPKDGNLIWGVGPALLAPTGTESLLSGKKWAAGPTAVVLKQTGGWTYGALANHLWSFAGDDNRSDINQTFLQPFVSYTNTSAVSYTANFEATYNWDTEDSGIPLNLMVTKVGKLGNQLISVGGGVRYWVDSTDGGPEGWGARIIVTFLFPK